MRRPKLIIVDNDLYFRRKLIFLIRVENSAEIIGKASNGEEFIELLTKLHPDVVLMDVDMPQLEGIEVIQKAIQMLSCLKIFAFTLFGDDEYIINLIKIGVKGFILKSSAIFELDKNIHSLFSVENYDVNNQIINIINNAGVNRLYISKVHKRISNREKKRYPQNKLYS